jgi:predicted metal-dependent hydrolase
MILLEDLRIRRHPRARRLSLSVDLRRGDIVLTWPRSAPEKAARTFVAAQQGWIVRQRARLADIPPPSPLFYDGALITVAGRQLTIRHTNGRGVTRIEEDTLIVHGAIDHLSRRVANIVKAEALRIFTQLAGEKAARIGQQIRNIRVADPRSRWGSCTSNGRLMFSWRAALAPLPVIDYLAAHEVAHLRHMNHGPAFWALCESLLAYGTIAAAESWIKTEGSALLRD